jgi:multiple sugar transport system permease protein
MLNNQMTSAEDRTAQELVEEEKSYELRIRKQRRPYTFIVFPGIVLTILFLIPFLWGIFLSFTGYRLNNPKVIFNWGANYGNLFTSWSFWHSTLVTFIYTAAAVAIEMVLGFYIASLLDHETVMSRIMRRLIALPFMVAPIIGTLLLKLMLNNRFGVVNYLLGFVGLRNFPWAASTNTAMLTVVLVDVWIFTPFVVLILFAGKRGISRDPINAASVDGANSFQITRRVILPAMMPTVFIALIFRVIDSIIAFDIVWGMTGGGPGDATTVYAVTGYVRAFLSLDVAKGTTVLVVAWLIVFLVSQQMVKQWNEARKRLT